MCGFVGILKPRGGQVCEEEIRRMQEMIRYRGPDDSGRFIEEGLGLGHVRLSILDLSPQAAQPMIARNQRFIVAYNGEVYNFKSLRTELQQRGIQLKSTGDTETLLEYIAEFGVESTLGKLEGLWAFALWDRKERALILARDLYGIKPLYYTLNYSGEVRFASEMKALLSDAYPDACTLNGALLGYGCTWGEHTVFRGIRAVRPGEWLVFHEDLRMERHSFFDLTQFCDEDLYKELCSTPKDQIVERVNEELERSIDLRMISDAPLACLVSGGLDSSLISALASKRHPNLELYHADVVNNSERDAAERLAKHLGLKMFTVTVTDEDFLDRVPIVTHHNDIPIIYHLNSVPFYMVSELASRNGIKVILTGEGSDEFHLGYPRWALRPLLDTYQKLLERVQGLMHVIPPIGRLLWPRRSENFNELIGRIHSRFEQEVESAKSESAFAFITNSKKRLWHVLTLDLVQGHLGTMLHRNDRLGMAWGLESRFPFLGYGLARLALNLPGEYKIRKCARFHDWRHPFIVDKWCIRQIADRLLPSGLTYRPKIGFPISVYDRIRINPDFFKEGFIADWFGLNRQAIETLFDTATKGWLGRLMLLEVWGQVFPMKRPVDQVREKLRSLVSIEASDTTRPRG